VLDALEQALHDRRPCSGGGPVHHSAHGSQYLSIRYTERLAEAGLEPSVGSVGDSYDNALAETNNGLTRPKSSGEKAYGNPWKPSNRHPRMSRLVQFPPPARADRKHSPGRTEANYSAALKETAIASLAHQTAFGVTGAVHPKSRDPLDELRGSVHTDRG